MANSALSWLPSTLDHVERGSSGRRAHLEGLTIKNMARLHVGYTIESILCEAHLMSQSDQRYGFFICFFTV